MSTPPMDSITFKTKSIYWEPNHFNNILLQNSNGPCFLISLVNSLILSQDLKSGGIDNDNDGWITVNNKKGKSTTSLKDENAEITEQKMEKPKITNEMLFQLKTLLTQPQVKLTDLLNELTTLLLLLNEANDDLTSILNKLSLLHTGLNVNPDFNEGIFDTSKNEILEICNKFGLVVVHGWLIDKNEKPDVLKNIDDYESLQDLHLQIIDKIGKYPETNGVNFQDEHALQSLRLETSDEKLKHDVGELLQLNKFLNEHATELTSYGLSQLKSTDKIIKSNEIAIFFRNNHFNTIYKKSDNLYLLLIDEGFTSSKSYNSALVWESLTSINGSSDLLLDGNFQPAQKAAVDSNPFSSEDPVQSGKKIGYDDFIIDDSENQVTKTQDELLALSLQQEEDETYAKNLQSHYNKYESGSKTPASKSKKKIAKKKAVSSNSSSGKQKPGQKESSGNANESGKDNCIIM